MPRTPPLQRIVSRMKDAREARKERHRPSGFGFAQADRIAFLPAQDWDRVAAKGGLFAQRAVLQLLEKYSPPAIQTRYALVYDGATPVAALFAQRIDIAARNLIQADKAESKASVKQRLGKALAAFKTKALGGVAIHTLLCGHVFAWGAPGVVFAPDADPARVWPGALEALYRLRNAERRAGQPDFLMIKDVACGDSVASRVLKRHSYQICDTEPDMVLEIQPSWKSFADYLGSLNSKYRKIAQSVNKDCAKAGVRFEALNAAAVRSNAEQLRELYLSVQANNAVRLGAPAADYLPDFADFLGDRFRCIAAWQGERLCGFAITLKDGETAMGYFLGFDRALNNTAPLYFALLQATLSDAIEMGCRRLSWGRTAMEPKARLGAHAVAQCAAVRHRHDVLNPFLPAVLKAVIPHGEAPERHPFKD